MLAMARLTFREKRLKPKNKEGKLSFKTGN